MAGGVSVSAFAKRLTRSRPLVLLLAGVVVGRAGLHLLSLDYRGHVVEYTATAAVILVALVGGIEVGRELRRTSVTALFRTVLVAAITTAVLAAAAQALMGLGWAQAVLLGVLLTPTDGAIASALGADGPKVSALTQRWLNLEAGVSIGLALPLIALLTIVLRPDINLDWGPFLVQEVGLAVAIGAGVGGLAAVARSRCGWPYSLAAAVVAYAIVAPLPHGDAFIAVYACALTLAIARGAGSKPREPRTGRRLGRSGGAKILPMVLAAVVVVVFGSLLTRHRLTHADLGGIALVPVALLFARPVAVLVAHAGHRRPREFGIVVFSPTWAASMALTLLAVGFSDNLFNLAALVVLASVVARAAIDAGADVRSEASRVRPARDRAGQEP